MADTVRSVPAQGLVSDRTFYDRLGQLLDEERHAIGLRHDLLKQTGWQADRQ